MIDLSENVVVEPLDRPAILFIGSPSVGKRTILQRLVASSGCEELHDEGADLNVLLRGWTIKNKYYEADVAVWTVNLHKDTSFSVASLPSSHRIAALVLIFDISQDSSLAAVQEWVSTTDTHRFDILLCIANKVDLLPTHPAHTLNKAKITPNSINDSYDGIYDSQTISLLDGEEVEDASLHIRTSCLNWCTDHNFEYIEACGTNPEFDKCLSMDGDSQGVERIIGALSAHMWPGMALKSGNMNPLFVAPMNRKLDSSEDESDFEFEYQVLSEGATELCDDTFCDWTSADGNLSNVDFQGSSDSINERQYASSEELDGQKSFVAATASARDEGTSPNFKEQEASQEDPVLALRGIVEQESDLEDVERLLSEIGNARDNLRFLPDSQRREMAASLALKMASMFGCDCEDESD